MALGPGAVLSLVWPSAFPLPLSVALSAVSWLEVERAVLRLVWPSAFPLSLSVALSAVSWLEVEGLC